MQTAGANNLPLISLNHSTFIHAFLTHTFTYIHKLTASGLGLNLLSYPLPCLKPAPSQSFSSLLFQLLYPHLLPGCTLNCCLKHASSMFFAYNNTYDILCARHSPPYSMTLVHILLLPFLLCFGLIISSCPSSFPLCT